MGNEPVIEQSAQHRHQWQVAVRIWTPDPVHDPWDDVNLLPVARCECGQELDHKEITSRLNASAALELPEKLETLARAVVKAQWSGEGGHYEQAACPFCAADPYYGPMDGSFNNITPIAEHSVEKHAADCPVRLAAQLLLN